MTKGIIKTKRVCISCGQEYEAHEAQILGLKNPILFGGGNCPACAEQKMIDEEKREAEIKTTELNNKRESWRKTCGIPRLFLNQRFDTFNSNRSSSLKNAYNDCLEYADKFPLPCYYGYRSLVVYSNNVWGVGKSHLACAIAHKVLDRWQGETEYCPVRYTSEPNLFMRIRSTFNRQDGSHETEAEIYKELTSTPLLIIDDMGKEEVSDPRFVQRVLFAVINGRYDNMLPVVITANLNPDMLDGHLGGDRGNSATFSRLIEMTGNAFREIVASSYRDLRNRKVAYQ